MIATPPSLAVLPTPHQFADFASTPLVMTIFLVTIAIMVAISVAPSVGAALEGQTDALLRGQVWRLVTYALTHIGWAHLAINMTLLFLFGPQLELIVGPARFATIYVGSSALAATLLFALQIGSGRTLGASAAVFGVLGGLVAANTRAGGDLAAAALVAAVLLAASGVSTIGGIGTLTGVRAYAAGVGVHALALVPGIALGLALSTSRPLRLLAVGVAALAVACAAIAIGDNRRSRAPDRPAPTASGMQPARASAKDGT